MSGGPFVSLSADLLCISMASSVTDWIDCVTANGLNRNPVENSDFVSTNFRLHL